MAKPKPTLAKFKPFIWPTIAVLSLLANAGLVGRYWYLVNYDQLPLLQTEVAVRCNEPGYSRFMNQIKELNRQNGNEGARLHESLRFAAASNCFVDYDTGRSLDLDSLKPGGFQQAVPAKAVD
jgi:hypothetical protein